MDADLTNNNSTHPERPWNSGPVFPQLAGKPKTEEEVPEGEQQAQAGASRKRKINKLDANLLTTAQGLPWLVENGKKLKFEKNNQIKNLKVLLNFYQIWSHQLIRGLNFREFILKTEKLTKQNIIRQYMSGWKNNNNNPGYNEEESFGLDRLNLDSMFPSNYNIPDNMGYGGDGAGFEIEDAPAIDDMPMGETPYPASNLPMDFPELDDLIGDRHQPEAIRSPIEHEETEEEIQLTDDQLAIIEANRKKAMEKLAARKRQLEMEENTQQ